MVPEHRGRGGSGQSVSSDYKVEEVDASFLSEEVGKCSVQGQGCRLLWQGSWAFLAHQALESQCISLGLSRTMGAGEGGSLGGK